MTVKRLIFNGTTMSTASHIAFGLWRHPEDQHRGYLDVDHWVRVGQILERGRFDALFLADALGQLDVYGGDTDASLRWAAQSPVDDPLLVISAIGAATRHLGFGVTVSTTYEHPYLLARKFTTLDHLTRGRIGWNVVTSQLDSAARNLGLDKQIPHDERYDIAEEFIEVAVGLWERTWDDDAVVADAERGVFTDPSRVRGLRHRGKYFTVVDAALSEPSIQRTPVLFQAGSSPRGRDLAARTAEVVFLSASSPEEARVHVQDVRTRAHRDHGRDPSSIKFVVSFSVIPAETDASAEAKRADYARFHSVEGTLAHFSAITGVDWSGHDLDTPLKYIETDSGRGFLANAATANLTLRQIAGGRRGLGYGAGVVGSPQTVADEMQRWADVGDIDGFNLGEVVRPTSWEDFVDLVTPELQERGLAQTEYQGTTLREQVHGAGTTRLPADHPLVDGVSSRRAG
ncbi:LLM class flavin-dependent oxidoreductase [Rhodococcus zopfii]|uniref:LLM class flavin-dependent oxidoreductase n=1 Tax=Rhodococcus zopfii TaxID=43772 RepID=UPI0011111B55|nr:LLM class flavin-dependent oxidoreductase [Rhodococcus zopfii]